MIPPVCPLATSSYYTAKDVMKLQKECDAVPGSCCGEAGDGKAGDETGDSESRDVVKLQKECDEVAESV